MTHKITLPNLFAHAATGGLSLNEWELLDGLQRTVARLTYLEEVAHAVVETPYDGRQGLLANVWAESRRLALACERAKSAIREGDLEGINLALDAMHLVGRVEQMIALSKAHELNITIRKPRSQGGKATAKKRQQEAEQLSMKIQQIYDALPVNQKTGASSIIAERLSIDRSTVNRHLKKSRTR